MLWTRSSGWKHGAVTWNSCGRFLACTRLDDPTQSHIVPRGVTAETDAEFESVMSGCLAALDDADIAARS